eukprot:CAMPEP_0183337228 /NCGR_PEP_ID=MMETSP0164_2-20130417/4959_1 /TAXON_ID=221442 /ORGANISM="Coccolithus pelagicus ssp braarudi, Strain PLY182g" /LENGTH=33 /DNA_ID= /DNA_START= /DNA_END= /DNA_ORIENTATION=
MAKSDLGEPAHASSERISPEDTFDISIGLQFQV